MSIRYDLNRARSLDMQLSTDTILSGVICLITVIMIILYTDYRTYLEKRYSNHIRWDEISNEILSMTIISAAISILIETLVVSFFVIWSKKNLSINAICTVDGLGIILDSMVIGNIVSSYFITRKLEPMKIKDLL